MKERPILFSGQMVRAILDGRKTQTRRAVKYHQLYGDPRNWQMSQVQASQSGVMRYCPYGREGDRLWVRETWNKFGPPDGLCFAATDAAPELSKWKPSIHMPRWASRITLENPPLTFAG